MAADKVTRAFRRKLSITGKKEPLIQWQGSAFTSGKNNITFECFFID